MTERYRPPPPPLDGEVIPPEVQASVRAAFKAPRQHTDSWTPEQHVPGRKGASRKQGPLYNARHERFAQAIVMGKRPGEAYIYAGFKGSTRNCSEIMALEHVQRRIYELQERAAERVLITADEVIKGLKEIATKRAATKRPLWGDKLRALENLGKIIGMFNQEEQKDVAVTIVVDSSEASY